MSVFLRPNKKNLKNGQHYEFMDVFITVMDDAGFTAAKIVALLNQLRDAFSVEDRWYTGRMSSHMGDVKCQNMPQNSKYSHPRLSLCRVRGGIFSGQPL